MVTIAEGISAATLALKAVKDLREIDRSISEADFKLKIATLTESMANVKLAMVELQDDLKAKDNEISRLDAAFRKKADTVEKYNYMYDVVDGQPVGRAYCNVCIQKGEFYHIEQFGADSSCPKCKAKYPRVPIFGYKDA